MLGLAPLTHAQSITSRIDELVNEYGVDGRFMGSVLVADKGEVIFAKGYGRADVEQKIPNAPETGFMIGSITKQFTAMLAMQLVEGGRLNLDDRISDFLPYFPEDIGDKITIEMLLGHTSGLPFPEGIEKHYYASTQDEYMQEFIRQLSAEGLHFEPRESYKYSNAGYHILGIIIEDVTGKTYEDVLNEQILKPLGISNTGCDKNGSVLENRAYSHQKLADGYITWSDMQTFDPGVIGFGSGFMYSTVGDLFKFSKALSGNKLLSKKYMDMYLEMRTVKSRPPIRHIPEELVAEFFRTCGNGFVGEISIVEDPDTKEKRTLYWHDGTWKLFKAFHYHFSGNEQYITILSNCSLLGEGDEMALKIHHLLNNKQYEHVHIKRDLTQYIEEDIAMHAGIPATVDEYLRLKHDTVNFIVPEDEYLVAVGRHVAELGDLDNAILIIKAALSESSGFWEAHDALGDTYITKGDTLRAVQSFKKSLELNPQNAHAAEMLKKLEKE